MSHETILAALDRLASVATDNRHSDDVEVLMHARRIICEQAEQLAERDADKRPPSAYYPPPPRSEHVPAYTAGGSNEPPVKPQPASP
jgi:hypothetical protein